MLDHKKCIQLAVDFSDSLYSWVLNQTLYVKEVCTSGRLTISFFLVTQYGFESVFCWLPLVISLFFGLISTLEQYNIDLM